MHRTRWSALGAVLAVTFAGGVVLPGAGAISDGPRSVFVPITPCRLFDTRAGTDQVGPRGTPIGPGEIVTQPVAGVNGNCTIPADATAISLNVTAANPTASSYLTLWPSDAGRPLASNLNWTTSSPATPNKVDVKLSADGKVNLYNLTGTIDVLADVVGYYVGHDHDDRYYTKAQIDVTATATNAAIAAVAANDDSLRTDSYGAFSMQFLPTVAGTQPTPPEATAAGATNCFTIHPGQVGHIPLVLPVGARLLSMRVSMWDGPTLVSYTQYLRRTNRTLTATVSTTLHSWTNGEQFNRIVDLDSPPAPLPNEIVGATESFFIRVEFGNASNAFCGATVTYDTKP